MCIFPVGCKILKKQGVTVLELIVVLIIIGVIATIGIGSWQAQLEREYADNAKITLKMLWQAEENFFAWKNRYTNNWPDLEIDNPDNTDRFYEYTIEQATSITLLIKATRRGKSTGFQIDRDGTITSF